MGSSVCIPNMIEERINELKYRSKESSQLKSKFFKKDAKYILKITSYSMILVWCVLMS